MGNEKGGMDYQHQIVFFAIFVFIFTIYSARQFIVFDHEVPIKNVPAYVVDTQGELVNPGIYFFSNPPSLVEIFAAAGITRDLNQIIASKINTRPPNGSSLFLQKKFQGIMLNNFPLQGKIKIILDIPINLNTATIEDLSSLPGIGPDIAEKIVSFRDAHGDFTELDELKMVKGIGAKRFMGAKKYLTVKSEIFIPTQFLFRKEELRG